MTAPTLGTLVGLPVADRPDLLAGPVTRSLADWPHAGDAGVVEIDPELADTAACSAAYDLPLEAGANCVVIAGKREGVERVAACVVPADKRADVNALVKRMLDVRKCSFMALDRAVAESAMEYGGITPVGLPTEWRVLVDRSLLDVPVVVIGSGVRRSKILLPGRLLAELPRAEVVTDLGL